MKKELAYVHTNGDSSLSVIANLVQSSFRVPSNFSCLYNQFLYIAESLTGISWERFYSRKFRDKVNQKGHTPQAIVKFANRRQTHVVFSTEGYENVNEAVNQIKLGQPVIMVISNNNPFWKDSSDLCVDTCEPPEGREVGECVRFEGDLMDPPPTVGFHAVLLIGYDSKHDFIIGRESDDNYGYRGYFKIKKSLVEKHPNSAAFFAFTVKKV